MNTPSTTILIVDDNPTNLSLLFDALQEAGYRVIVAQDGVSALERLNHTRPDIILLDIMMPHMDGFETLRQIKARPGYDQIPVIFMTAVDEATDEVKGLSMGAVDYITKPIRVERVLARIKTHLTLYRLQLELQEQKGEMESYAHTVAHDLKGPLTILLGYAELMAAQIDELGLPDLKAKMESITHNVYKQIHIVNALLLLSSVRRQDVALEPIDMSLIVYQVRARLAPLIEEMQAEIILPPGWPAALGYEAWVEEVWINYASNALKYGGDPPRLIFGATPQADGFIRFWLQDNGPGLSPAAQSTLFREYNRLQRAGAGGHGLGLSIVKRIIEKLGGTVGVESALGQGSTFFFTLPAGEPEATA